MDIIVIMMVSMIVTMMHWHSHGQGGGCSPPMKQWLYPRNTKISNKISILEGTFEIASATALI